MKSSPSHVWCQYCPSPLKRARSKVHGAKARGNGNGYSKDLIPKPQDEFFWHGKTYTHIRSEVSRAHEPMDSGASGCRQGCQLSDVEWTSELVDKVVGMKRNTLSKYDCWFRVEVWLIEWSIVWLNFFCIGGGRGRIRNRASDKACAAKNNKAAEPHQNFVNNTISYRVFSREIKEVI